MIAAWLFELLRREADWHAALPRIAAQISELPEDRIQAALDLGAAFEHLEPDRRRAIGAYQLAGPRRDGGRSRALATQLGWWPAVARLAQLELQAKPAIEPLIAACRALIDAGDPELARRIFAEANVADVKGDATIATLRAELAGNASEWKSWLQYARALTGRAAADALVSTARLARADGRGDWATHLEAALAADPGHRLASAMLTDHAFATGDRKSILDVMKLRLVDTDTATYCDVLRDIAARVTLTTTNHGGLARRLLRGALDRAYEIGLSQIRGHLAMWSLLDRAAAQDRRRTELLRLIMRALELALPDYDRMWLAALGAAICVEAGDAAAARSYAAVIAERAPSHPTVLALLVETRSTTADPQLMHDLDLLQLDAATVRPVRELAPTDTFELAPFELAPMSSPAASQAPAQPAAHAELRVDPRYVDVSVPVLDDPEPPPEPPPPSAPPPRTVPPRPPPRAAATAASPAAAAPVPPATEAAPAPATALDDEWQVDEELFVPRKRSTVPPSEPAAREPTPSAAPDKPAASPARVEPPPARPAAPAPPATPAPAKPSAAPASLIPAAAMQVLKAGGGPRALPKIPLPTRAVPRADRTAVPVDIRLSQQGRAIAAHTRDLSTTGFFVVTAVRFEIGVELDCEVPIPGADGLSEKTFTTRAKIVRRDLAGYGAVFVEPPAELTAAIAALAARA